MKYMDRKKQIIYILVILLGGIVFTSYRFSVDTPDGLPSTPENKQKIGQHVAPPLIPDKLAFAGENVPLDNFDVIESLDKEIMVNTYFHSQTIRFIKLAPRFFKIIEPLLKRDSIPDDFKYLALAESGFDTKALSPAGAAGIWQFMKPAARENGLEVNNEIDERYHIEKATEAACKYLHTSYEKYGNWTTVAASYNAGRNGIDRQVERQKETHYYDLLLSEETSRYVYRILALKVILESPETYGFFVDNNDIYPEIPVKIVKVDSSITNFADFAKDNNINYKILKLFNPWLRENYLTNSSGKTYHIKIPKGKYRKY
jgi:hypothetical protein